MRLLPGDPALVILSEGDASFTQEELDDLRKQLGTDRPIPVQYLEWIGGLVQGDLGTSIWRSGQPVTKLVGERIPRTLELAVLAILIAVVFAVPLGVISAIKPDSFIDYIARVITLVGISIPTFFAGLLVVLLLSRGFGWLPPLGFDDIWEIPWNNIKQMFLPGAGAGILRYGVYRSRNPLLNDGNHPRGLYADSASQRVGGAHRAGAAWLKNAVLPILTISGWQFGRLFGGTVIIESIFKVPGIGTLLIETVFQRDFPTIQAHHHRHRSVHRHHQPAG